MRTLLIYLALSCLPLTSSAWADIIHLKNGDRISGTIVLLDSGQLLLKTPYAGTISLDIKQISTLESEQQFIIKQQRADDGLLAQLHSSEAGKLRLVQEDEERQIQVQDIHQLIPYQTQKLTNDLLWTGSLHLAADYKRKESDSDKYDLSLKTQLRHGRWRHGFDADYEHETKDESKKTDRFTGAYELDYFMTQRWFWKGKAKYTHDRMEDVRRQTALGSGPGFQFWDNALGSLSASTLLSQNRYSFSNGEREHFSSLDANWSYRRYFLAKTLELYYQGEVGLPFTPEISYMLEHEAGLRYKLNSWASFTLKTEWEKIRSQQGDMNDRRYLMGVGVSW